MPAKERNASPAIQREIFIVPDREITVDPSGKKHSLSLSGVKVVLVIY